VSHSSSGEWLIQNVKPHSSSDEWLIQKVYLRTD
jgi:hypothetical protein